MIFLTIRESYEIILTSLSKTTVPLVNPISASVQILPAPADFPEFESNIQIVVARASFFPTGEKLKGNPNWTGHRNF